MRETETLYRGMNRAEIDRQLNLRARWPEHADYFARWARESAAVRAALGAHLDLAYGPSPGQALDIFPAATDEAARTVESAVLSDPDVEAVFTSVKTGVCTASTVSSSWFDVTV